MEKMRYLGGTGHTPNPSRLTVGDAYEVLEWFNPGATMLNGLVRDKDGALYVAQTFNDPAEWAPVVSQAPAAAPAPKPVREKASAAAKTEDAGAG